MLIIESKNDFLTIVNYSLYKGGKKLIKSATTVLNSCRPRNKASRAAKHQTGKGFSVLKNRPRQSKNKTNVHTTKGSR